MAAPNSSVGDQKTSVEFRETGLRSPVPRFHNGGNQLQSPAPPSPSPWMDHDQLLLACAHGRDIVQVIRSVGVSSVQRFQATGKPGPMAGVDNIRHSLHFSTVTITTSGTVLLISRKYCAKPRLDPFSCSCRIHECDSRPCHAIISHYRLHLALRRCGLNSFTKVYCKWN